MIVKVLYVETSVQIRFSLLNPRQSCINNSKSDREWAGIAKDDNLSPQKF